MKQITKIKILSVVFVLLGIVAWFALQQKLTTNTITKDENKIAIEDTASIKKVIIEKNSGKEVLTKTASGWMINGKYQTSNRVTALLLVGLNQLQIKRPVSQESKNKVIEDFKTKGETVTVEYSGGKKVLKFMTNTNDINTTYLLTEGSDQPYIAYVPGISNDINNLFLLTENDWRTKKLFTSTPRSVKIIKVNYPADKAGNFEIENVEGKFQVKGVANLDTAHLFVNYLPLFEYISVSHYLTDKADSVQAIFTKTPMYAKLEIEDLYPERSNYLEIYKDPVNKKEYLGRIGKSGEPVTLNKELFDNLLVKKSFFEKR